MTEGTRKMEEIQAQQVIIEAVQKEFPNVTFPEPILEPIFIGRLARKPVEGRFAVVDSNNGEVFGLCTDQYKLLHHEEVIESVRDAINGIKEFGKPDVALNLFGGKMVMDLIWKNKKNKAEVRKGDYVAPRVRIKNSYDLGWKLEYTFGAMQLVCTNGMTALKSLLKMSKRHTTSLRPEVFANEVGEGLHNFSEQVSIWSAWAEHKMSLPATIEVVEGLPFSETEGKKILELAIMGQPEGLSLTAMHERKVPVTLWDVHNASTQFLTHEVKSNLRRVEDEAALESAFGNYYSNLSN